MAPFLAGLGWTIFTSMDLAFWMLPPGSLRDFQDRVYSYLNYPVTSSSVGSTLDANLEQQFGQLRDDFIYNYFWLEVAFREEGLGDLPATSWLHTQYAVQESIMKDGRRPLLEVVYSGQGISQERLETHGYADETLELFTDWQQLAPVLDDEDVAYIANVTTLKDGSSRYESEYILVLSQNDDGDYIFTPRHIMGQTTGEDEATYVAQEFGTVIRQQLVNSGTALELTNPLEAQELSFILSVDHEESNSLVNPIIAIDGSGKMSITGTVTPGEYLMYDAGDSSVGHYDKNWNLIDNLDLSLSSAFSVDAGTVTITVSDGEGSSVALETEFIVDDEDYVLATNENL